MRLGKRSIDIFVLAEFPNSHWGCVLQRLEPVLSSVGPEEVNFRGNRLPDGRWTASNTFQGSLKLKHSKILGLEFTTKLHENVPAGSRASKKLTPDEESRLIAMRSRGMSFSDIARSLNRDELFLACEYTKLVPLPNISSCRTVHRPNDDKNASLSVFHNQEYVMVRISLDVDNEIDEENWSGLAAVHENDLQPLVELLIDGRPDTEWVQASLSLAAVHGKARVVEILLEAKAEVDKQDRANDGNAMLGEQQHLGVGLGKKLIDHLIPFSACVEYGCAHGGTSPSPLL